MLQSDPVNDTRAHPTLYLLVVVITLTMLVALRDNCVLVIMSNLHTVWCVTIVATSLTLAKSFVKITNPTPFILDNIRPYCVAFVCLLFLYVLLCVSSSVIIIRCQKVAWEDCHNWHVPCVHWALLTIELLY